MLPRLARTASASIHSGLLFIAVCPILAEAEPPTASASIELREGLAITVDGTGRRAPIAADPIAARIVAGDWSMPTADDEVRLFNGSKKKWQPLRSNPEGRFSLPYPGSYLAFEVTVPGDGMWILEATGHTMVYVNGEPRAGDLYDFGYQRLPVSLRKGKNTFLFQSGRGALRAKLVSPRETAELNAGDMTTPDLVVGQPIDVQAAIVVLNNSDKPRDGLAIRSRLADGPESITELPPLIASSARKLGFRIRGASPTIPGSRELTVELVARPGPESAWKALDTTKLGLRVLKPEQTRKITFRSKIDGSIQYYALVPALPEVDPNSTAGKKAGLVLTLHGAGVEGIGQAESYSPKPGLNIVAATNRRQYGFDWEDWGRLDALEVLEIARASLGPDPTRIYLTGHSMGGHGTWQLGVTFPDHFAAIAPSAGWISMWSYAGAKELGKNDRGPVEDLLGRAVKPSDTLALVRNLANVGVYILHGDADDNVPVGQAREMRRSLGGFHPDFVYHEQPGAGHWWGSPCVDWPPLFAFFETRRLPLPKDVRQVDFVTASPGVSPHSNWLTIEAQLKPLVLSEVHFKADPEHRKLKGKTENVQRLALDLGVAFSAGDTPKPIDIEIDGQTLPGITAGSEGSTGRVWLERSGPVWKALAGRPSLGLKGPHRYGPFKNAFRNHVVLVHGTKGSPEENAWSFAKARYDAETFGYRGNGSFDVLADETFLATCNDNRDRDVIIYGNSDTNAAWKTLLGESPIRVSRDRVRVGDREVRGDDLGCMFLRPRPGSDSASIGVVAGTGLVGNRSTNRLPYFVSGVGYPDFFLIDSKVFRRDSDAPNPGILGAGYFGPDWSIGTGEFAPEADFAEYRGGSDQTDREKK